MGMKFRIFGALSLLLAGCGEEKLLEAKIPVEQRTVDLQVVPTAVEFGAVNIACTKVAAINVINTGTVSIELAQVTIGGAPFLLLTDFPKKVQPGRSFDFGVQFAPGEIGNYADAATFTFDPPELETQTVPLGGEGIAGPPPPLDLVFVIDVSTTMGAEINALYQSVDTLLDHVTDAGLDVHLGLTTYVNDVIVHGNGAVLPRSDFFSELETQLEWQNAAWGIRDSQRQADNWDMPENLLDALYRTADEFAFRTHVKRYLVLMTDDTFMEPPAVYTGDNPALYRYDQAAVKLLQAGVVLHSIHSLTSAAGLSEPYNSTPSLVDMTGGTYHDILDVVAGQSLDEMLNYLVDDPCGL